MSIEINNYNANICITPQINNTEYNTFKDELQHELNTLIHERDTFINPELDYLKQEYTNINYEYDQLSILSDRVTKLQTKCNNTYNNLIGLLRRINNGEVSNDDNTSTIIVNYTKLLNKRTNKYHNVYDDINIHIIVYVIINMILTYIAMNYWLDLIISSHVYYRYN